MRKLASIATISNISQIENADRIEIANLCGKSWNVCVKKGEFHPGDKVIFFEIDAALPAEDERYHFLRESCLRKFMIENETAYSCIRIQTKKMRGVVSQGLILPISEFPEIGDYHADGMDVSEVLKIEHYDDLKEKYSPKSIKGDQAGVFPFWLAKSDEERIQNLGHLFTNVDYRNLNFEVTEKYDGCSATYFCETFRSNAEFSNDGTFGVCSRNYELKESSNNVYWEISRRLGIKNILKDYLKNTGTSIAIQGEIVGPGINQNRDKYTDYEFYVYRIYIFNNICMEALKPYDCTSLCESLGFKHVKVIEKSMRVFLELQSIEDMLKFVEGKTERGNEREGMVFKEVNGPIHFKCINNEYLMSGGKNG